MATIFVDGKKYEVNPNNNLLHECLQKGIDIPYFCWHPVMGSIGSCRQCAVKQFRDENDMHGMIVMSCMVPAAHRTRISVDDEETVQFRKSVIEWLMTNHPHDCPVCDEGGECHLQDMTVMTGHAYRRFRFKKRTYVNQYLGPLINHEMNRCIQCYRCVRFYKDYAHGDDFDVFGAHNHVYFGRHEDGVLQNEFSGNLVEVCPTGVFTDKTLKQHYTRKWDMTTAPSVCTHCSVGCNTIAAERYSGARRILNRYNGQVNGYFLCDRGRYGYDYVNADSRIRTPMMRNANGEVEAAPAASVLEYLRMALSARKNVIGIGSPRAPVESNFALKKFVGPERFYTGLSDTEAKLVGQIITIFKNGPVRSPSLKDIRQSDAVFVIGEDVTNTAPMMALALRQSVSQQPLKLVDMLRIPRWHTYAIQDALQNRKGPFFIASVTGTKLDDIATRTYRAEPDDIARLAFAVAHIIDNDAPAVKRIDSEIRQFAEVIADALKNAERPLIVSGTSLGSELIVHASANVAAALAKQEQYTNISYIVPEANTMGVGLLGGGSIGDAIRSVQDAKAETLIIFENDLYRRAPKDIVDSFLKRFRNVIVVDYIRNETTRNATAVLPAGTFAETDGTFINYEGRAQRFFQVYYPEEEIQESWRWLRDATMVAGYNDFKEWYNLDAVVGAINREVASLRNINEAAPSSRFRIAGMKMSRASARYSGRTAIRAHENVSERKPPEDPDAPFTFTMEGFSGFKPPGLTNLFWAPRWNSVQALTRFQEEIGGPLRGGDPGVRMIEPSKKVSFQYFSDIPAAFEKRKGEFYAVPLYHIFGSDELSIQAPWIRELAAQPYLLLNNEDAGEKNISEDDRVDVQMGEETRNLPVKVSDTIPTGVAGIPAGVAGVDGLVLPAWVSIGGKLSY
jgi:NADH-quinone oxidoreductase subunit G